MEDHTSQQNWRAKKIFFACGTAIYTAALCISEGLQIVESPMARYSLWATGLSLMGVAIFWFRKTIKELIESRVKVLVDERAEVVNRTEKAQLGFMQTISDDVRGPLMGIVTGLRDLSQQLVNNDEGAELNSLYKQGIRLQGRLNSALELGKTNTAQVNQARPIDLSQLASDLAENYAQALLDKPNLLLNILVDHRLPQAVEGDPHRLMLLMGNMLENALNASEQGQIVLKISSLTPNAPVGSTTEIEISCSDCGAGMAPARVDKLADEIVNMTASGNSTEIGLGLRAAVKIIRSYQGSISISSKEGKGTTVNSVVKLPVITEPREWKQMPKSFRFCSSTQETYIALGNAGFFHGVTMVPIQDPTSQNDTESILVDGSDLVLQTWGPIDQFKPRNRYVVMLHKDQYRLREKFLEMGFSRFLSWPLVSTMLLKYLTDEDTPITTRKSSKQSVQKHSTNILVVDDAETNRLRICYHLRSSGHHVTEATDGLEMVSLIKSGKKFDLILTDLNMTHLNGEEALKQIRELEGAREMYTPAVAISAYVDADAETKLKKSGFDAVLKKPVYLDELDFLVSSMVPEKREAMTETKLIDLEELKARSNGKTRLMAILLDSFIQSSKTQLQDLRLGGSDTADKATYLKTIHTLKGLLLEAGAKESAGYLNHVEKQARYTGQISIDEIEQITQVVNKVSEEAAVLRDGLTQQQA